MLKVATPKWREPTRVIRIVICVQVTFVEVESAHFDVLLSIVRVVFMRILVRCRRLRLILLLRRRFGRRLPLLPLILLLSFILRLQRPGRYEKRARDYDGFRPVQVVTHRCPFRCRSMAFDIIEVALLNSREGMRIHSRAHTRILTRHGTP